MRRVARWFLDRLKNAPGDRAFGNVGDFSAISSALSISEPQSFADRGAQAVSEMREHLSSHRYRGLFDTRRGHEKYGHAELCRSGRAGLLEKRLHFVEEAVTVGFHGHPALFCVLHQEFFLFGRQFGGDLDFDGIDLIACRASLKAGDS